MTAGAVLTGAYVPTSGGGGGGSFSLAVTLSTYTLSTTAATSSITTTTVTATPTGGTPPYNYAWTEFYNPDFIQPTAPYLATTGFRRNSAVSGDSYYAEWQCTVTDAIGSIVDSDVVAITISRT